MARNIGLAALRLGDSKEAALALRLAVDQNPHDQTSQARLAMLFFQTDDFAGAAK